MGLFKKNKGDVDDEAARGQLFGSRKGKTASPAASNPYAAPPKDPYAQAPPPAYSGNDSYRQEKSPSVTSQGGQYGGRGYQAGGGSYAQGGGSYGQDRYGGGADQSSRRPGGYGGLGNTDPNLEEDRGALFGGAADRAKQQRPPPQQAGSGQGGSYGQSGVSGGYGGYGTGPSYEDRQLTAEEQEEEDINATKNEIKFMKQQDVSSTRNALRLAQQAEETGRDTLARLGAQGERIHNTERNLDLASSQNRIAEEKARELKTLNRSMETHQAERVQRDQTRAAAWASSARQDEFKRGIQSAGGSGPGRSTLADRAKYQFEADSEDDEMENEIDSNLDQLHGAAKRLNALGRAMGQEVDSQNKHIDDVMRKTDKVDDQIALNRARLDRIH
ncbi:Protein transport protein S9 plasma membrane t-SNARE [Kalmusia sp. IMI 367209]|nr:Protein transport protein S9 plasma membrane t-SNARE [Kalmusia sp. IMI 367209]